MLAESCNACMYIANRWNIHLGCSVPLREGRSGEVIAINHHHGEVHLLVADADFGTHLIPLKTIAHRIDPNSTLPLKEEV
jgi:hypothetical protein